MHAQVRRGGTSHRGLIDIDIDPYVGTGDIYRRLSTMTGRRCKTSTGMQLQRRSSSSALHTFMNSDR